MTHNRIRLTALVVAGALALAGCNANAKGGTGSASTAGGATATGKQGGTLYQLSASKEIHFDPAKSQNLGTSGIHLIVRGLTTWKTDPGKDTELVPDLATDLGRTTDGGKTWTFTLKSGLKYADGTAITSKDVKFGVERSFDAQLQGGLSYHKSLLEGGADYTGPATGKELASIETPDDTTITFHLNRPFGDWAWITSMPAFAPVPAGKGMGNPAYDHNPPSSGPYQVDTYAVGSQVSLKRNPNWDKASDPVRLGGPDKVVFQMGLNAETSAQRLVADSGEDKNAGGASVVTSIIPKINADAAVKARTTVSSSGALNYLALNTTRPGLGDIRVRKAIEYVVNKQQVQTIAGGPEFGGAIATTVLPPGLKGYTKFDLYPAAATGDLAKAKEALAGAPVRPLTFVVDSANAKEGQQAASIANDLKQIGIQVSVVPQDTDTATDTETKGGDFDLALGGWQADYPGAYAMIQPLFAKDQIGDGNYNISRLDNPAIDAAITAASAEADPAKAATAWSALDKQVLEQAPIVPLYYGHQAYLNGSNVTGTYIPTFPTYPNVLIQSLKQ